MKKVVVAGGTSKIAQEVLKCFACTGAEIFLAGRDGAKLAEVSKDLRVRGAVNVETFAVDLNDVGRYAELLEKALKCLGKLDVLLIAHGSLPEQSRCQRDVNLTLQELSTNFLSAVSLLTLFANYFENQRGGSLAVISSVAGDRGRQSNYVYGAAKGALTIFLQGLRHRLAKSGVTVITIKPGFVDTPMTASFQKNFLYADASVVGRRIFEAIVKGKEVIYVPSFWRWVMLVIRLVPESIFKKTRL